MSAVETGGMAAAKRGAGSIDHTTSAAVCIVAGIAGVTLAVHLATCGIYGLFVDELYFLACGEHLTWGYVDMPPLTALQAWLARRLFGDSMLAIRLFPAVAGAGLVLLGGALARELGGRRFAQGLAALAVAVAPAYLAFGSYLSMNAIEPLLWMGCVLILVRMIHNGKTQLWLWFGFLVGVGMENKHTMLLFAAALLVSLLLTGGPRLLHNRWFVLGGVLAAAMFLPNLMWMIQHGFPHLELLANIRHNQRNVALTPLQLAGAQILSLHPVALPLWIAGLWRFLASRAGKQHRALGWAYLLTLAALLATAGRFYYLFPVYPMLLAGGAVAFEEWLAAWHRARVTYVTVLAATGVLAAPIAMPLLPPEMFIRYARLLHVSPPPLEHRETSALPQFFADRFGWPEMVATVAAVYHALPAEERAQAAIFGSDYGEAGAIDFYGPAFGLPKAISGHLTYWYWGPRQYSGEVVIVLGEHQREHLEALFRRVDAVATVGHPYAMRLRHFEVYVCRGLKDESLQQRWAQLKNWN